MLLYADAVKYAPPFTTPQESYLFRATGQLPAPDSRGRFPYCAFCKKHRVQIPVPAPVPQVIASLSRHDQRMLSMVKLDCSLPRLGFGKNEYRALRGTVLLRRDELMQRVYEGHDGTVSAFVESDADAAGVADSWQSIVAAARYLRRNNALFDDIALPLPGEQPSLHWFGFRCLPLFAHVRATEPHEYAGRREHALVVPPAAFDAVTRDTVLRAENLVAGYKQSHGESTAVMWNHPDLEALLFPHLFPTGTVSQPLASCPHLTRVRLSRSWSLRQEHATALHFRQVREDASIQRRSPLG